MCAGGSVDIRQRPIRCISIPQAIRDCEGKPPLFASFVDPGRNFWGFSMGAQVLRLPARGGEGDLPGGDLGAPQKIGNNFGHKTLPNTVENRDARRKEMHEEPTT